MQWVYFTLTALNAHYNITSAYIRWGKWYESSQNNEISNDMIRGRVFKPNESTRFGASGRDGSPSGTEGGFSISTVTSANKLTTVLEVYFDVPWVRKGGTLNHRWSNQSGHFCYVGSFDCNIRLGAVEIICGQIMN